MILIYIKKIPTRQKGSKQWSCPDHIIGILNIPDLLAGWLIATDAGNSLTHSFLSKSVMVKKGQRGYLLFYL